MYGGNWSGLEKKYFIVQHGELYILGTPVQLNQGPACTHHQKIVCNTHKYKTL